MERRYYKIVNKDCDIYKDIYKIKEDKANRSKLRDVKFCDGVILLCLDWSKDPIEEDAIRITELEYLETWRRSEGF